MFFTMVVETELFMIVKRLRTGMAGTIALVATLAHADDDPYQTFNRHAFALNQAVDKGIYRPAARAYKAVVPEYGQNRIAAFFNNIGTMPIIINDFLEGKVYEGSCNMWRMFFNTTLGGLGFYDVATSMGLPATQADFGMTLAQWGYQNSNYFVIPFLGPSTVRDAMGTGVDLQWFSLYQQIPDVAVRHSLFVLNFVQTRAQYLDFQSLADHAAVDPYVFERNAYLQRRNYVLSQNVSNYKPTNSDATDHGQDPFVDE